LERIFATFGRLRTGQDVPLPRAARIRRMDFWLFLHLVAMAFFLGGQLMLAVAVVPAVRGRTDPEVMTRIAQNFGVGSAVALGVLLLSGLSMASHYDLWSSGEFHLKMGLFVVMLGALGLHMKFSGSHVLMAVTFLLTLAIVWVGIQL
jgi:hypothetical protein